MPHPPTPEQSAIITAAGSPNSLMISAYAGCAKSTSLEMAAASIREPTLALAFNKKIAAELGGGRLPENFTVRTLNAMGHRVWARTISRPSVILDDKKLGKLISTVAKEWKIHLSSSDWEGLLSTINRAMSLGIVPGDNPPGMIPDSEESWLLAADLSNFDSPNIELAREILHRNNELSKSGIITFSDQIYAPTCLGGKFPQYPRLMIDEAQDLSPLNHRMLELCLRPGGHLIAVGDPRQAIYQFRGADAQSMQSLRGLRERWIDLPLTLTFRCPKAIVERQQSHAPGFTAHSSNQPGKVINLTNNDDCWNWANIEQAVSDSACQSVAILCRNNAPLMSLAFKLIRQGHGVEMAGREIGKGLSTLAKKICPSDSTTIPEFLSLLERWEGLATAKALSTGDTFRAEGASDRAECLRAVAISTEVPTVGHLRVMLEKLFSAKGKILLSSIHRAKGLEWDCVVHLDPWRIPSRRATSELELEQEYNLGYVAETRTRNVLVLANLGDFR